MPRFAANLSMMYQEFAVIERFAAAAQDGFAGVEILFPYDEDPHRLAEAKRAAGVTQVLINTPPGDFAAGERGLAAWPERENDFARGLERALDYAAALDCSKLHVLAGLVPQGADRAAMRHCYLSNLEFAAKRAGDAGLTLLIEPINPRDIPGYFLQRQQEAHDIVAEIGAPNLKVQMDLYHCQIVEGDLTKCIERHLPGVAHFQVAGVPDRHEPDEGEICFPFLFELIDRLGFNGWIGCEYRPRGGTREGLGWLRSYLGG